MLIGCGNKPKDISEIKDATPADSMMYYFGEMQANAFWQDAQTDTLLRSEEAREAFLKGCEEAIRLDKDNEAYNKGLQLGVRLALRLREFEERYGVEFPKEVLIASLQNGLKSDSGINISDAQKNFYKYKGQFEQKASKKEIEDAKVLLAKEGAARDFQMLNDTLYAKDIVPGEKGPNLKEGDRVSIEVTVSTLEGKEVVARQFPDSITIGEGRAPEVVRNALYTMTSGQTRQFMTTPRTLFGRRYAIYNLPHEEPVIFTVKADKSGSAPKEVKAKQN